MIHVNGAGFCDRQVPVLSTIGRGPKGPQGEKGDDGEPTLLSFADPIEWDIDTDYAKSTIVLHDGDSYASKVDVPHGIDITDGDYWVKIADFNGQVEACRQMTLEAKRVADEAQDMIDALLPSASFSAANNVKKYVDSEVQMRGGFAGANIMCITDSWGSENVYGVTKNWMHIVCDSLRANYIDLHQGSTGFIAAPTFLTRAQQYAANNPDMVDRINYIFVCGGNNDVNSGIANIQNAINNTINYLLSTYTNAIIYYFPQISGADMSKCSVAHATYNAWYQAAYPSYRVLINRDSDWINRVVFVSKLQYCLVGFDPATYMNADFIHPKQIAHNYIAQCFLDCVIGNSTLYNGVVTSITNSMLTKVFDNLGNEYAINSQRLFCNCETDGTIHVSYRFIINNFTLPSDANELHIKIPYLYAINNQIYEKNTGIAIISSGSKCAGIEPYVENVSNKNNGPTDNSEPIMDIVTPLWPTLITNGQALFVSGYVSQRFTF